MSVRRLTPAGAGGVAVVEVSGRKSLRRLEECLAGPLPALGRAALVRLMDTTADPAGKGRRSGAGGLLDEALLLHRGVELVELCLHGNPLLVRAVIERLEPQGESRPSHGSCSVEAEAWRRLPHIESECGARLVLDQALGALRRGALAWARGEEQGPPSWVDLQRQSAALLKPPLVVLTGASNVGKSTLFNLLLGEERVVVSEEAGTTRDTIAASLVVGDWVVQLVDTAGERDPGSHGQASAEREGQRLGRELAARAELILELVDFHSLASEVWPDPAPEAGRRVIVSRADALGEDSAALAGRSAISALRAPEHARALVTELILDGLGCAGRESPWQSGRAVPFEWQWAQALEEARSLPAGEEREQRVLSVLNGDSPGPHEILDPSCPSAPSAVE